MPRPWEFQLSTRILFGRGSLRRIGETAQKLGQRALLVGYREPGPLADSYDRVAKSLEKAGVRVDRFCEVVADPSAEVPTDGARRATETGADLVVALGGGSVLDVAKGIAALARMGGRHWDYADANKGSRPVTDALPLIAIPTTAGTGSEVSSVAVFTFAENENVPAKAAIYGPAIVPRVAVVDPDLAVGSPAPLTAACAADALGHAIESAISRAANPISSVLAGRAAGLIVEHLPRAVEDPNATEPREGLALAATLAGAAFNEAGVAAAHVIAQGLGAVLQVPHAVGVAVGLPVSLRFNLSQCVPQLATLADCCKVAGDSDEEKAARFVDRITTLLRDVGLPARIEMPTAEPSDLLDRLVAGARAGSPSPITCNPRKLDPAALRQLLRECL